MPRYTVRRRPSTNAEPAPSGVIPVAIGLAAGAVLGFLLGEWLGPVAARVAPERTEATPPRSMAELVHDAQSVLVADVQLREWQLDVVPVGRGRIDLRGWVGSRAARTRAARLVSEAVSAEAVLNSILVRGEDDLPESYPDHGDDDMVSA
jgi:hypothetical protein